MKLKRGSSRSQMLPDGARRKRATHVTATVSEGRAGRQGGNASPNERIVWLFPHALFSPPSQKQAYTPLPSQHLYLRQVLSFILRCIHE
jgi:hypothetical protein